MTRVIAGQARGRRLQVPSAGTRPTTDRVRESLFASLESVLLAEGRTWADVSVCDAYAGSGAVALEAWSRGAQRVCVIESAPRALKVIESNIDQVGAGTAVDVLSRSVAAVFLAPPVGGSFDVLFLDPPYEVPAEQVAGELIAASEHGWLSPEAVVVVERSIRDEQVPLPADDGFVEVKQRRYGESALWYGRFVVDEGGSQ